MRLMGLDVPEMKELLHPTMPLQYGDQDDTGKVGGARHLSSVLPAVSSAIGHPIATPVHPSPEGLQAALNLPDADSAVVVLVDGLGFWNLATRAGHVPYLRSLLNEPLNQLPMTTCLPSTTVAAMGVFGTGTCPGLTGMTGYTQLNPENGLISQMIQFRDALDPLDLQRQPTVFEQLVAQDVRVTSCGLPRFRDSALTRAALRGSVYQSANHSRQRVLDTAKAAREPGLTYLYIRDVDKVGHHHGWDTPEWIAALESADALLALLHRSLPKGTLVVIVADHGMVAADPAQRIDIACEPVLNEGVELVGGEPRAVMLYARKDVAPEAIAERWRTRLGDLATVMTREEAIGAGLFGEVDNRVRPMIGDLLVLAHDRVTLVDSRIQIDAATRLPGVHGSSTVLETRIPCLIDLV